ncbi:putative integral membrane protein [Brugia pahangi]
MIILLPGILLNKKYAYKMAWMNDVFCKVRTYSTIAMSTKLYFLLLLMWMISFATSFADFYFCARDFQVSTLHCSEDYTKRSGGKLFNHFLIFLGLFLSIAIIIMYSAITCNIRRRFISVNHETRKTFAIKTGPKTYTLRTAKYERSMLIQVGLTSGGLIFGIVIFSIVPLAKILGQKSLIVVNIFQCFYIILYRSTLPTAFFLTNERARKFLNTNVVKPIQILTKQVTR